MALSTREILKAVAPELEDKSDDTLDTYIELAAQRLSAAMWGDYFQQGVAYLAAHLATLADREGGAAGPVQSEQAGQVSRSYGVPQNVQNYRSTAYGEEFLALRRQVPGISPLSTNRRIDFGGDGVS